MLFQARQLAYELEENAGLVRVWRWQVTRLTSPDAAYEVLYIGPDDQRARAARLFGAQQVEVVSAKALAAPNVAIASHLPLPGALRVPTTLHMIVPLDRPLDHILGTFHSGLRRMLLKRRPGYTHKQVVEVDELERLRQQMLTPYADARHGDGAVAVSSETVQRIARGRGRLDVLTLGDEELGCHLGYVRDSGGFLHWVSSRHGYPQRVFDDHKRFGEVNAMNNFLAFEWAKANGFHAHDLGSCVGRPEDGLLQWKRRRGGNPDASWSRLHLSVRLPRAVRAELLWDHPLFSVEGDRLSLSLGLPADRTDSEAALRYRELRFGGLASVALHAARVPGAELLTLLRGLCPAAELYVHGA